MELINHLTSAGNIQNKPLIAHSITDIETSIPAFIGFTEKVPNQGPVHKINSLFEYIDLFGRAENQVDFNITQDNSGNILSVSTGKTSNYILFYTLQMYFANGGGPAYISSAVSFLDSSRTGNAQESLKSALDKISSEYEPSLLVFPDSIQLLGVSSDYYTLMDLALKQCTTLKNRFVIMDVPHLDFQNVDWKKDIQAFRSSLQEDIQTNYSFGAAYYPYLRTRINFQTSDESLRKLLGGNPDPKTLNSLYQKISQLEMILPPSSSIAGVYVAVDQSIGVWKAPANFSLQNISGTLIQINDQEQGELNIDPSTGKSINAIRNFPSKGTLVWGARTLDGNNNDWKYISIRRFLIQVEQSIQTGLQAFQFEPNDSQTWVAIKSMIENYLLVKWRVGALAGVKEQDAYFVRCGLGETMTNQDILNGKLIVEIGLAALRPAEFIIISIIQIIQGPQ